MRGNDARTHTNKVAINIDVKINIIFWININLEKKNDAVNTDIMRILAYSAIKINANIELLYSVLNPETSSDSPSARSNGVRFVSARLVINHKIVIGKIIIISHECIFIFIRLIFIDMWKKIQDSRINDIDTSYEIVWAILRSDPSNEYFEFEHHPAKNVE
jgi:hypothetical protein